MPSTPVVTALLNTKTSFKSGQCGNIHSRQAVTSLLLLATALSSARTGDTQNYNAYGTLTPVGIIPCTPEVSGIAIPALK